MLLSIIIKGALVLVTNGVYDSGETVTPGYSCSNRVVITKDGVDCEKRRMDLENTGNSWQRSTWQQ